MPPLLELELVASAELEGWPGAPEAPAPPSVVVLDVEALPPAAWVVAPEVALPARAGK